MKYMKQKMVLFIIFLWIGVNGFGETIRFRYLKISIKGNRIENSEAWKNATNDCAQLIHKLLDSVEHQEATVLLDKTIEIKKSDTNYLLESNVSNLFYVASSKNGFSLKKWPEPVGTQLFVRKKYKNVLSKSEKSLCIDLNVKNTSLIKREKALLAELPMSGKPVLKESKRISTEVLVSPKTTAQFLYLDANGTDWIIGVCQIQQVEKELKK